MTTAAHHHHRIAALAILLLVSAACSAGSPTPGTVEVDGEAMCDEAALTSALAAGAPEVTMSGAADTPVMSAVADNPVLGMLVEAIDAMSLTATLDNAATLTLFAPTDCAFAALDPATREAAFADPTGLLSDIVGFHLIAGARLTEADLNAGTATTFSGREMNFLADGEGTLVDGQARIVQADIQTANATVHLIDRVMLPPGAGGPAPTTQVEAPTGSTAICDTAGLMEAIQSGPADGTLIGMADDPVAAAASANPVLSTLVEAVVAANLSDTLNGAEALTVFAPTDCAFALLDPTTIANMLADPSGLLTRVLGFHVVVGQRLTFADLVSGELATLADVPLALTVANNVVTLHGNAQIIVPNIQTANATVHLIDRVLLPPSS